MLEYRIKDLSNNAGNQILDNNNWELDNLKFIVFEYLIPRPIFPPIKRISTVYCMKKSDDVGSLGLKYNVFNFLTCWIGLPFGPIEMISVNKKNKTGIDITNEIAGRISIQDIQNGKLKLPEYEADFVEVSKEIKTSLINTFKNSVDETSKLDYLLVGYVKLRGRHIFYIGLKYWDSIQPEKIIQELAKDFTKSTRFELIDLTEQNELVDKLNVEGVKLII